MEDWLPMSRSTEIDTGCLKDDLTECIDNEIFTFINRFSEQTAIPP
jgi:hypothetical protein